MLHKHVVMDLKYLLCEPVSKFAVKANEQQAALIEQQQTQHHRFNLVLDWHANSSASSIYPPTKLEAIGQLHNQQQEWNIHISSPKSICSSVSTCSSISSTNSGGENDTTSTIIPGRSQSLSSPSRISTQQSKQYHQRRRAASDVSLTKHHMFIYSHPNRRPRSESSASNNGASNNNVQTRTPWTPYEDHLLQQGYDQGLSWAMISSTYLPHRSRGCCWGRFKTLQNKNMIDSSHAHMRHFRRPWKAIDFSNNNDKKSIL